MLEESVVASLRAAVPLPVKHAILRVVERDRDLVREVRRQACVASARLVEGSMAGAHAYKTPAGVLDHALDAAPPTGIVAEFGVYSGATLRRIAARRPDAHGFDSFEGLPEDWRGTHPKGTFAVKDLPPVGTAELHVGWFADTVPAFLDGTDGDAAFLHLDADLYSSTDTVLRAFEDRIEAGTVLLFDEYFNYPGWQEHEHRAFGEFIERTGREYEYVAYNSRGEQVAVRML